MRDSGPVGGGEELRHLAVAVEKGREGGY